MTRENFLIPASKKGNMPGVQSFSISVTSVAISGPAKQRWSVKVRRDGEVVFEVEIEGKRSEAVRGVAGISLPPECKAMMASLIEVTRVEIARG